MVNYLTFFPKPLLVDLCENQVLPFIGSGFSLNAKTPPGRRMPLIDQIAGCLNELMPDYTRTSPMDIISEFDVRFGRAQLAEEFYKILLVGVAQPGPAHLAFARLPFDIVATTNIEQLLEEAYFQVGRFPQVVMFDEQLPVHDTADDPVTLLKVHGDVNFPDRIIFTEADYDTFVARYPLYVTYLASLLITRTPLFIGYSVDDYDFRQIWNIIGLRLGRLRRQAYAIEVSASPTVIARYQRRGVEVINLPGNREDFGPILTQTFRQLRRFLANNCPPAGIPPCSALGVPIDVGTSDETGSTTGPEGGFSCYSDEESDGEWMSDSEGEQDLTDRGRRERGDCGRGRGHGHRRHRSRRRLARRRRPCSQPDGMTGSDSRGDDPCWDRTKDRHC